MTTRKASVVAVVGLLGIIVGAYLSGIWGDPDTAGPRAIPEALETPVVSGPPAAPDVSPPTPAPPARRVAPRARATKAISISDPALHARIKPLLNRGANMSIAAEGFRNAEEFAMVAHAARNTAVPFMLLKHRVLDEGQTLAEAIRASKPEAAAVAEANRARASARSDIAAIAG